jgi:hypothetical protein
MNIFDSVEMTTTLLTVTTNMYNCVGLACATLPRSLCVRFTRLETTTAYMTIASSKVSAPYRKMSAP